MRISFHEQLRSLRESDFMYVPFTELSAKDLKFYLTSLDDLVDAAYEEGIGLKGLDLARVYACKGKLYFCSGNYYLSALSYRSVASSLLKDEIVLDMIAFGFDGRASKETGENKAFGTESLLSPVNIRKRGVSEFAKRVKDAFIECFG